MPARQSKTVAYTLRPATDADRAFCYSLVRTTLRHYFTDQHGEHSEQWHREHFDAAWPGDLMPHTRIVEVGSGPIGQLTVYREVEHVFVKDIELLPGWQCRGVGAALIRQVIDEAAGLAVQLKVMPSNPHARIFYERLQFRVTETTEHHLMMRYDQPPGSPEPPESS